MTTGRTVEQRGLNVIIRCSIRLHLQEIVDFICLFFNHVEPCDLFCINRRRPAFPSALNKLKSS